MKPAPGAESVDQARLLALLPKLREVKIVVVGDVFLDEYVVGKATRLSREAPVPVLEFEREFDLPGAAANPARNIRALGGKVTAIGVVGADDRGERLRSHLISAGIDVSGIIVDRARPTVTKSRVVAEDGTRIRQQIVRIDRLDRRPLAREIAGELASLVERAGGSADAVLISDYKTGVVCPQVVEAGRSLAAAGRMVAVDSQGDLHSFGNLSVVKDNQQDAEKALGIALEEEAAIVGA
jgi:rfaE bifunctional protein kinase chain/domain